MDSERIGRDSVKITVDRVTADRFELAIKNFTADIYSALLVISIVLAAQERHSINFTDSHISIELIKSTDAGVIYISRIRSRYRLSQKRSYHFPSKRKMLHCIFEDASSLTRFIMSTHPCTFLSSRLYSDGTVHILSVEYKTDYQKCFIKEKELCRYNEGHSFPADNNFTEILSDDAIGQLRDFLF